MDSHADDFIDEPVLLTEAKDLNTPTTPRSFAASADPKTAIAFHSAAPPKPPPDVSKRAPAVIVSRERLCRRMLWNSSLTICFVRRKQLSTSIRAIVSFEKWRANVYAEMLTIGYL
jgi:hypothetical protein